MEQNKKKNEFILKKYCSLIKLFEDILKSNKTSKAAHQGHLIKLSDFEELKNKIDYKNHNSSSSNYSIKDSEKIMKIKDLEIKSRSYLNNLILNDNSYIIIDNPLWKVVNEKEEDKGTVFDYKVDSYNLTIIVPS